MSSLKKMDLPTLMGSDILARRFFVLLLGGEADLPKIQSHGPRKCGMARLNRTCYAGGPLTWCSNTKH